jgi:hypothetical protein
MAVSGDLEGAHLHSAHLLAQPSIERGRVSGHLLNMLEEIRVTIRRISTFNQAVR